jgi:hypothetical protein
MNKKKFVRIASTFNRLLKRKTAGAHHKGACPSRVSGNRRAETVRQKARTREDELPRASENWEELP